MKLSLFGASRHCLKVFGGYPDELGFAVVGQRCYGFFGVFWLERADTHPVALAKCLIRKGFACTKATSAMDGKSDRLDRLCKLNLSILISQNVYSQGEPV
ncbi:MAG: hypothetical protein VW474_11025 [Paracoccaceae bacterium]